MDASTVRLFSDAVDGYIAMKRASREWTGGRTEEQFRRNVMDHGRALLNQRIDAIEPPAVYSVLMRLMDAPATLHMVKASIASVFRWAKALGYCDRNPCDGLDDALPKKPKAQGREAMEWQAVPGALAKLREAMPDDYRVDALELLILTGTRTREMAQAQIDEFDLDNAVWNIDGPRIKKRRQHIIPLCDHAMVLVRRLMSNARGASGARLNARDRYARRAMVRQDAAQVRDQVHRARHARHVRDVGGRRALSAGLD